MKVILLEDVKGYGKKGELVTAADGYARNYLLPRRLAVEANASAMNDLKNREAALKRHQEEEKRQAKEMFDRLDGKTLKIAAKAGSQGRLFGSVTSKEIAQELLAQFGCDIDKRKIVSPEIKNFGIYECEIKLHHGVTAKISAEVGE